MPPVAAAPPIIGTLGRRRRPVRAIGFARDAPRTPSQSPGEGRLPPVRVRLRSRQKPEHVASPLVSILRKSRSDGKRKGFRSEPLESLTLRSFAIGSFSRRSIAYFCAAPRRCLRFQWRALSSGTLALAFDGKRRPTRRSRVVSALQITYPGDQRRTAARSLRRMPKLPVPSSGFCGRPKPTWTRLVPLTDVLET